MPELNPRLVPTRKQRFVQIAAAVAAGMGSMLCLQSILNEVSAPRAPRPAASAPAPAPAPEPAAGLAAPERAPLRPAPESHMLIRPEPGIADAGVKGVYGQEAPFKAPDWKPAEQAAAPKAEWRKPLSRRSMNSPYAANIPGVRGNNFMPMLEKPKLARREPPPEAARPAPRQEEPGASMIAPPAKLEREAEHIGPASIRPEDPPVAPFWTPQRRMRVIALGVLAALLAGLALLLGGVFSVRERREGEL